MVTTLPLRFIRASALLWHKVPAVNLLIVLLSLTSLRTAALGSIPEPGNHNGTNPQFNSGPNLGTASGFALFTAAGAIGNTGATVITGDVGTNVGAINGLSQAPAAPGPGTVNGQIYPQSSPQSVQAATDVMAAYNSLTSIACGTTILPELAGQTLTPGVYCQPTATATSLNGTLTLSGSGVFIIKLSSALTTATNSSIELINGATASNVFFQVNGAVDVGIGAFFRGTILANGAISLLTGASLEGRGLSIAGAINLNNNRVDITPLCCLSLTAAPSACQTATNQYTVTGTVSFTSTLASSLTITDGTASTTFSVTAGQPSATYTLAGLNSGTGLHTVTLTSSATTCGAVSATYTAPASCTVSIALSVTPGATQSATNQYDITGTLSLTNAVAGTATISDGATSTTVAVSAGATSVPYALSGLSSGTGSHTVTASYAGLTTSVVYTAPAAITAATVTIALSVTPGTTQSATNQYDITGTLSLTNAVAGTATITDGATSTTVAVSAGATSVPYALSGLSSGTVSHTVTATYAGLTASAVYTAPASISVGAVSIALSVTPGATQSATNQYDITGTLSLTNAVAGTATISDGATSTTVAVSAGATSVPYALSGLSSGTGSHTVTATYAGLTTSATYIAPAAITAGTVAIALSVTPGTTQSATNQYDITGTLSLTNAVAGTATITDGATFTTVAVSAGATSVPYALSGLTSGTGSHTVTATYAGLTASAVYTAPASISVGAVSIALSVTPGATQSATNQYDITGTLSLTNAVAGTATISDGATSTTVAVSAGATSVPYALSGLTSGTGSHTVTATYAGLTTSATYTAPAAITAGAGAVVIALSVTPGASQSATNQYNITGALSLTNAVAGTATITDGATSTTVAVTAGATSVPYALSGLSSGTGSHTVTATYAGLTTSVIYTAPAAITASTPTLQLEQFVSQSRAVVGDVLTYSLVLTNPSSTTAATVVSSSLSSGSTYVAASATVPTGTTFTPGIPTSSWTVPSIGAGQSLTLTFQVVVNSTGILYSTASIPGDTASVCTSIPVKICVGEEFTFQLTAPPGRTSYQWSRTFNGTTTALVGQTTNVLEVTAVGEYSLAVDNATGLCADFSCCPFIVEADSVASFSLVALAPTCQGPTSLTNGQITLSGLVSTTATTYTYQLAQGATFGAGILITPTQQALPPTGLLSNSLAAGTYTVRVYNALGCFRDVVVIIPPANCQCPADVCTPFVITQTKRGPRVGG